MKLFIFALNLFYFSNVFANSEIDFQLDKKYKNLVHPNSYTFKSLPEKSNVERMISQQTPIKSQGKRGTCSIFSTTAHLEALYMQLFQPEYYPDFSEQWLQYLNIANKKSAEEGSSDPYNIFLSMKYGIINEKDWNYSPNDWTKSPETSEEYRYCNRIYKDEIPLKKCLLAHGDPNLIFTDSNILRIDYPSFSRLTNNAERIKHGFLLKHFVKNLRSLRSIGEIKYSLAKGIPLSMGLDFYYGAFNHKKAEEFGIGRDLDSFNAGFVSYPELGSVDREVSKKKEAGHAVLVVGYDDNIIITSTIKMTNGEIKQFRYRGAYIVKNSWGTESLGKDFTYNGRNYPGYSYITYKYAHEFGGFYELPFSR